MRRKGTDKMKRDQSAIGQISSRSFKNSKGRNIVAVCAIVLTALMFTTLFVLSQSIEQNLIQMTFRQVGFDTHVSIKNIEEEQAKKIAAHPDVQQMGTSIVLALAENRELSGQQVEMRYAGEAYAAHCFALPTTGHMPQSDDEIALDDITLDRLGIPHEIGQQVTLEWRKDMNSDKYTTSTFTLCGFWEGNTHASASMAWVSEGFANSVCNTLPGIPTGICGLRMVQISLYSDKNIEGVMDGILADTGLTELHYGLNLAYDSALKEQAFSEMLPMYGGMLLVFLAGYMIIYNIFQISVTADIQFYGKLKTLGTSKKQLKRLIFRQANRLCFIGIPVGLLFGYLLAVVLVPVLIVRQDTVTVAANPFVFLGSALFAWLTVLVSCLRPAMLAGKVSPMEALRYNDASGSSKRKIKRGQNGASVFRMALANLGRNRKRTALVICSLTLGLVLLSSFYAKNASFDIDKYLETLTLSDFMISDGTSDDYINGYDPQGTTLSHKLMAQVEAFDGLESTGKLYSQETTVSISPQALENIKRFYGIDGRLDSMKNDTAWTNGYNSAVTTGEAASTVYGTDGLIWDVFSDTRYLMDGTFDPALFATGKYVVAVGVGDDDYSEQMPTFSVGEVVEIDGKKFTVMSIVYPLESVFGGAASFPFSLDLVIPADAFSELYPQNTLRKLYFNVSENRIDAAQSMLTEYQRTVDSSMPIVSRASMEKQYEEQTRSASIMGNAISVVIALVGILNFINSMITAIVSRKKEFAMLQSVGMTKKQLRKMLIFEGLDYAVLTLLCAYTASTIAVGVAVRAMVADGFSTFQFTLTPLLICTPILFAFAIIIPYICFKNLERQSVVQRLQGINCI